MNKFLLLSLIISISLASLDDQDLIKKYSIKIHQRGSNSNYPEKGDQVKVHYTGKLLDGTKFDSSKDRNQPFDFRVGIGQVIKCWDDVVLNLTLGDKVTVICPSDTAYGSRGAGRVIPPNSDLQFDIEMLGFRDQEL
ncbi:unnamed protein product [Paramecium sonneborni]|uniref:peptidylprolyl isomerase n=1 Tax=Paramecium sonneborni TaxID=65129 RepID=A0A8S1MAT7_9CILI|nr:unnamed protein product [Paramecium sonneborni]